MVGIPLLATCNRFGSDVAANGNRMGLFRNQLGTVTVSTCDVKNPHGGFEQLTGFNVSVGMFAPPWRHFRVFLSFICTHRKAIGVVGKDRGKMGMLDNGFGRQAAGEFGSRSTSTSSSSARFWNLNVN